MSQTATNQLPTHTLANGRTVYHLNEYETEFLYKELFTERVYLKHGITLDRGSVVVDVGANIGLLAVFLQQEFPGIRLVLVEPSPVLGEIIRANLAACGANAVLVPAGLADARKTAEFTFYAGYSIISGFKADLTKDAEFLRGGINNQLSRTKLSPERRAEFVESLMAGKLENPQKFTAQLMSFADLVAEQKLTRVDLLKIDAEGCELEILHGIGAANWPKIRQLVMEVHEAQGFRVGDVVALLEAQGFGVVVEQEEVFRATGIYNLYARRG